MSCFTGREHCGKQHVSGCYCAQITLAGPHILCLDLGGVVAFPHWSAEAKPKTALSTSSLAARGHGGRQCMFIEEDRRTVRFPVSLGWPHVHDWPLHTKQPLYSPFAFQWLLGFPRSCFQKLTKSGLISTLERLGLGSLNACQYFFFFLLICSGLLQLVCGVKRMGTLQQSGAGLHALHSISTSSTPKPRIFIPNIYHMYLNLASYLCYFKAGLLCVSSSWSRLTLIYGILKGGLFGEWIWERED